MSDKTTISADGKERVAFELLQLIAQKEPDDGKDRKYLLQLMYECMRAVNGHAPTGKADKV